MKKCITCTEIKAFIDFPRGRNECKNCRNKYHKKQRANNPRKYFGHYVKTRYGITHNEYDKCMSTSTKCEICNQTEKLVYDHNHTNGNFRGVLCSNCNNGLGKFKDNIVNLKNAILYLENKGSYG